MIELRGRASELAVLSHAYGVAGAGSGAVTIVEGDAGIGKSSLVAAHAVSAAARGATVYAGCADELNVARPFGVWFEAFAISVRSPDPRRRHIAELAGAAARDANGVLDGAPGGRFLVQDALLDLVAELGADGPMLITFDDLQWADSGSLVVLGHLLRNLRDVPLSLVLALRRWPRRSELATLVERAIDGGGALLSLTPLAADEVDQLVDDLVGAAPGPSLQRLLASATGNPFYVRELLMSAQATGRLIHDEHTVEVEGSDVPGPLNERILRRVSGLSADAGELLRVLAVAGGPVDARDLVDIIGRPPVPLLQTVNSMRGAGLLVEHDGLLSFQHDLVREAIRNDVPASARSAIHSQLAQVLIARRADPIEIASHLAAGANIGDPRAADWLRRAADQLAPTDPLAAADIYLRASELMAPQLDESAGLIADVVRTLAWAGRFDDAANHARRGIDLTPSPPVLRRLRIGLAEVQLLAGRVNDAVAPLRAAAAEEPDAETRANLWAEAATASLWSLDLDGCEHDSLAAIALAEECASANALARALGVLSRRMNLAGRIAESRELADRCLLVAGDDPAAQRATPHLYAGMSLWPVDPVESAALFREGLRRAERSGIGWALPVYLQAMVSAAFDCGDWDACVTHYDTARVLLTEMGDLDELSMEALVGVTRFHRNELPAARASLEHMLAVAEQPQARVGGEIYVRWLEALVANHDGNTVHGAELLLGASEICDAVGAPHVQLPFLVDAVEWGLATDQRDRALGRVRSAEALATTGGMPIHRAIALRCRAAADGDAALAASAVDELRTTNHRLDYVLACEQAGRLLTSSGSPDAARRVLEDGMVAADTMGALLLTRRLQAALRAAGGGRGIRGPRVRPATGWESLTETERQVVALVGERLTNAQVADRLYISRRTVETHLVHIYGKVGLASRTQLIEQSALR